jgi:hypothetical protein
MFLYVLELCKSEAKRPARKWKLYAATQDTAIFYRYHFFCCLKPIGFASSTFSGLLIFGGKTKERGKGLTIKLLSK